VRRARGVAGVAQAAIVPVSGSGWNNNILIEGKVQETYPNFNSVSPGYFETLRTGLVAGRDFSAADGAGGARVAIVNESFARKYFAGRSPLGLTFQIQEPPGAPRPEYQVVGVVQDTKYTDVREPLGPIGYFPAAQANPAIGLQLDPMETQIAETLLPERLMATLSGFFGGLAALIATIGLYGVMSYMVTRRRNEIGIRMALGANPASVVAMVMRESVRLVAAGTVAGAVLAVVAGRWASALLFELEPGDPATLAMSIAALGVVAVVASYLPAHRAARVDPTIALRGD
jgi:ABC-type antimicrobial peptide transport system permease subunit